MKVSLSWLQKYFSDPLPGVDVVSDALTFHAFEIEEQEGDLLDLKVLPDRAAYGLSHRGVATEVAAALGLSLKEDPLRTPLPELPPSAGLVVTVEDPTATPRYMAALVKGVTVGPSPAWLKSALESVGQRSINNVVDATNYVMLNIGQPLHAFDAKKLETAEGTYAIAVRNSQASETITTLTGEEYSLPEGILLITDATTHTPLGIAGVKGGMVAQVDVQTTDIIVESANFNGPTIRRASQNLKLWTDASLRFQNSISPLLAAYGMRDVLALITEIAGGTVVGSTDIFDSKITEKLSPVTVSLEKIRSVLGLAIARDEVVAALERLQLTFIEEGEQFIVTAPFERRDLVLQEDIIEEIGRTIGYDRIPSTLLPALGSDPDQARYYGIERIKDFLSEREFIELSTQSFAAEGQILLKNPLQLDRPWLRASLLQNLTDALTRAVNIAPRTLGPESLVRLFEIGSVFMEKEEVVVLALGVRVLSGKKSLASDALKEYIATLQQELFETRLNVRYSLEGDMAELSLSSLDLASLGVSAPARVRLGAYRPFSIYPAALRDVAVWVPAGIQTSEIEGVIVSASGEHLARIDCFDRFEKEERVSYAFRLVFEAMDRTLSDKDLDPAMERVASALGGKEGWEVR